MPKFYLSSRFWAVVLSAVVYLLGQYAVLPPELVNALYLPLLGHIGFRSLAKFEK